MAQHKADGWARVAEFMGDGLSAQQCQHRWSNHLGPLQRGLKSGNWQPDEVTLLLLYPIQTYHSAVSFTCLYMVGAALAGAGATASDPIALEHSAEGHDTGVH